MQAFIRYNTLQLQGGISFDSVFWMVLSLNKFFFLPKLNSEFKYLNKTQTVQMEKEKRESWTTQPCLLIKQKHEAVCVDHNYDGLLTRKNLRPHPDECRAVTTSCSSSQRIRRSTLEPLKAKSPKRDYPQTVFINGGNSGLFQLFDIFKTSRRHVILENMANKQFKAEILQFLQQLLMSEKYPVSICSVGTT